MEPKNLKELFESGYARNPALTDLAFFANPGTGVGGVNTISAILSLITSSTTPKPVTLFDDITALLANTDIETKTFAFVIDASSEIGTGWALYLYVGGDRDQITSYQVITYQDAASAGWPLSGPAALTGNVEIDLGSNKLTVGGTTNLVWYKDTADNSGGGTDLETTTDLDIFSQFPTNFPSNGYFVVALVKIKASAVQAGDEGTGFYASEKIYTIRRTYAPEVIIEGGEVVTYQHGDNETLNHTLTVEGTDVRLTVTTPAGDTYSWNVVAEIVYSSIFYEV